MQTINTQYGTVTFPETINDRKVVASLWEKKRQKPGLLQSLVFWQHPG
jgi:hypothetical protein